MPALTICILKSDMALAEVVFDEAIPKGTYLLTLYTRCGRGTDFRVSHCRSEVREKIASTPFLLQE